MDALHNRVNDCLEPDASLIRLDRGQPNQPVNGGNHFMDVSHNRATAIKYSPMKTSYNRFKNRQLVRPRPRY